MFLKVICPDGTLSTVKSSELDTLIKFSKIVAFKCSEGWIELRRKRNNGYNGPDRRVRAPY